MQKQPNFVARIVYFIAFIFFESFATGIAALGSMPGSQISDYALACITTVVLGLVLYFLLHRYEGQLQRYNPKNFNLHSFKGNGGKIALAVVAMYLVSAGIGSMIQQNTQNQAAIDQLFVSTPMTITMLGVFFAPLLEELIYRGIFMNYFWNRNTVIDRRLAIFFSGLIFGLMHEPRLSLALILYASLGWILATLYSHTKDIRCSMLAHMIYNGLSFLAMFSMM